MKSVGRLLIPSVVAALVGFTTVVSCGLAIQLLPQAETARRNVALVLAPASRAQLHSQFEALDYSLASVRAGAAVPRLYVRTLPSDLEAAMSPADRKLTFLRAMLPLILSENEKILADRRQLQKLSQKARANGLLSAKDYDWALRLAADYNMADFNPYSADWGDWKHLLRRVDAVPASLALAQAAVESGWGTSRFAQTGNALFGQWTWDAGAGMTPLKRKSNSGHAVRSFSRLSESVHAYLRNLNSHAYYDRLRARRAELRQAGLTPSGFELAHFVDRYASSGKQYVADLREVIKTNALKPLDSARLRPATMLHLPLL